MRICGSAKQSVRVGCNRGVGLFVLFLFIIHTIPTQADSNRPLPAYSNQWRYTIAFPMIWAPTINGKVRGSTNADFEISFKDILQDLHFGIMGELYANRGRFGAALRLNYMQVKNEKKRNGLIIESVGVDLKMGVNDFLATWQVHDDLRLVTGIRHVHAELNLDIATTLPPEQSKPVNVTDSNMYDFLFGVHYSHWFSQRWGIMINADVGLFGDNDRDFSTEIRALYRISDLNNFWFGFRYLNIGSDSTAKGQLVKVDMTQVGPTVGWAFTF